MNRYIVCRALIIGASALLVAGCGVRDTEVDGVPGPGARQSKAEKAVETEPPLKDQETNTKAGINSAGRPAGSAGGNPGAPEENLGAQQPPGSPPRRTDIPASPGPDPVTTPRMNERKPMPNDGERANTPGEPPPPLPPRG